MALAPSIARLERILCCQTLFFKAILDSKLRCLFASQQRVLRIIKHMPRHPNGIFHAAQVGHCSGIQRLAINDECVERGLAGFVGRAAEADGVVALVVLACLAAGLDGVEGVGGVGEGEEGGVGGGGEGAGPGVDYEGRRGENGVCCENEGCEEAG